jgi:hypothetical protein
VQQFSQSAADASSVHPVSANKSPYAFEVHFYDRRTKTRKCVSYTSWKMQWNGPDLWSTGQYSHDSIRAFAMYADSYPRRLFGWTKPIGFHTNFYTSIKLILVEKIVHYGEIIYQEPISDLSPGLLAILMTAHSLCELGVMRPGTKTKPFYFDEFMLQLEERREALAVSWGANASVVAICDQAIECARQIEASYQSAASCQADGVLAIAEESSCNEVPASVWEKITACVSDFEKLADARCACTWMGHDGFVAKQL